jgi:hypothetical protein
MKLLVLGGWNLETWASTTLMHMYDFLYGMVGAFGRRERGGGVLAVVVERGGRCGAWFHGGRRVS